MTDIDIICGIIALSVTGMSMLFFVWRIGRRINHTDIKNKEI